MNVLYDSEGYEYPVDDSGQIYVLLEAKPTDAGVIEEGKEKEKKLKRSYASVTVASATACPVGIRSQKNIKSWREAVKYLPSVARARFLKKNGSVLTLNMVALRKEMEERNATSSSNQKSL